MGREFPYSHNRGVTGGDKGVDKESGFTYYNTNELINSAISLKQPPH